MQREFICGDCMNFLPDFPDNYFDVAVVDPPYGIKEHGGKNRSKYVKQKMEVLYTFQTEDIKISDGTIRLLNLNILNNCSEFLKIKLYGEQIILIIQWLAG